MKKTKKAISSVLGICLAAVLACSCTNCTEIDAEIPSAYDGEEYHLTANDEIADAINEFNRRLLRYDEMAIGEESIPEDSYNSFNMGWQVKSLVWQNVTEETLGEDKIALIYKNFLKTKTQDDYGYIYNQNDFREDPKWGGTASWGTVAGGPQGWTFPTWKEAVADPFTSNGVADRYFTSFDFNSLNDDTDKNWKSEKGTFNVDGSGYAKFAAANNSAGDSYRFYKDDLDDILTRYGGIDGSQAAFVELDMDFKSKNLGDISLVWKTTDGGDEWFSASAKDYVTVSDVKYDVYGSRSYWPMYLNEKWAGKTITAIGVEFTPVAGKKLILTDGKINYLRPSYDTRQPQFTFQWFESFYNYVCYTRDLNALEELMPKARKAMLFMLHCMQGEKGLVNLDFFSGHNGIGTTINEDGSITTHPGEGIASGYWDTLALPEINAESNAYFYTCLKEMAELEAVCEKYKIATKSVSIKNRVIGQAAVEYDYDSEDLYALLETVKSKFSEDINPVLKDNGRYTNEGGLWNPTTGRFALGVREDSGAIVDHGYVLFNEQAIVAGLGTDEQRLSVMQWINGDRTVEGDLSVGKDIYFYEFAPRFTTADCVSQFNFSLANLNFGEESALKTYGSLFSRQVQDGGAVIWSSYYDLVARARVLGADNAYKRLKEIVSWYNKVKENTEGEGEAFFANYYFNLETNGEGGGNGYYNRQAADEEGAGAIGVDSEFLENVIFVRAIPDALFGMETDTVDLISFTYDLPENVNYLRLDNLKFGNAVYSVSMTYKTMEISSFKGGAYKDTMVRFNFAIPEGNYKVYVNGKATDDYEIENGFIRVTVPFGAVSVSVK